ncbi:LysM peptidoglycan-binding domain-containing protein [Piscinibacter koreensis]|uniref:LysM peptidoglycan-binding domain-containing protein n=1 Tax=Piscinibacter koreensis TaxID=2742824 RepID=A0A7Y6NNJ9_9BURK|nr:LysM domain-containing protein [Schlegelella koreensis]NUZ06435.1 LysM peptidoglycan-binding domain-containing protein [Schlegelella koreensis]
MSRRIRFALTTGGAVAAAQLALALAAPAAHAANYPVTPEQRSIAARTAETGIPVSELVPNAPDTYTVRPRDTLWDISAMFIKSPWRWPELWGMNLEQVRNPHLIYPGQVLVLDTSDGRARLRLGRRVDGGGPLGDARLSPRVRSEAVALDGISSIPFNLIEPFLNEAVIFETNELSAAPRIVAAQEGRVMLSRGDIAYVRGELGGQREYRIFRTPRALKDPTTNEVLGYEATYVGSSEYVRQGETRTGADGKPEIVPATFTVTSIRQEAGIGDRLAPVPPRDYSNYAPHAPAAPMDGRIVSIYGDALTAGQNQIVALNKGARDGIERGHVLALWRSGSSVLDRTDGGRERIRLPDERHGVLFVFRVFDRMSYALIMQVQEPVKPGDRFTQP